MQDVQRYERYDAYQLVGSAVKDADGFMRDSPIVARTGVYIYLQPDGSIRREYRPAEEVFNAESLASFEGKPITVDHPKQGKVTAETAKKVSIGSILSAGYLKDAIFNPNGKQDKYVACDVVLFSPDEIGDRRELSLGYRCDVEEKAGTTEDGQQYDAIQRNIRVNHLAVVKKARAGMRARLNCDGDEYICRDDEVTEYDAWLSTHNNASEEEKAEMKKSLAGKAIETKEKVKMSKFKLDGMEYDLQDTVIAHIEKLQGRVDAAESSLIATKTTLESVEATLQEKNDSYDEVVDKYNDLVDSYNEAIDASEKMQARIDAVEEELEEKEAEKEQAVEEAKKQAKAEMAERSELEEVAKRANVEKVDGMSNKEIKIAVLKQVRGDKFSAEDKTDAYIEGAFDIAKESLRADGLKEQVRKAKAVEVVEKNDGADKKRDHRAEMMARLQGASQSEDAKF